MGQVKMDFEQIGQVKKGKFTLNPVECFTSSIYCVTWDSFIKNKRCDFTFYKTGAFTMSVCNWKSLFLYLKSSLTLFVASSDDC